jgi:hypothetical protein
MIGDIQNLFITANSTIPIIDLIFLCCCVVREDALSGHRIKKDLPVNAI